MLIAGCGALHSSNTARDSTANTHPSEAPRCAAVCLQDLEKSALVPAWAKVLCPEATKLVLHDGALARRPLAQPMPHRHLQHLEWAWLHDNDDDPPPPEHTRQQLAALPSLTSLSLLDLSWAGLQEEDEQQAGRLVSNTVTRLQLTGGQPDGILPQLQRLPTQFPHLRVLDAADYAVVYDDGLDVLLRRMPHLERLNVWGFRLKDDHTRMAWPWRDVRVRRVRVDSFARLPLDSIPACSGWWRVEPSADAAAVARVAQAIRRWGGMGDGKDGLSIDGREFEALLTTLGPLVAALPPEEQRDVTITDRRGITAQEMRQLGQHLPAGVATLRFDSYKLAPDAWPALLPSLPSTVEEVQLGFSYPCFTEEQVLALCRAAVRPIRVVLCLGTKYATLDEQDLESIRNRLVGRRRQPGLVTLVWRFS